MPESIRRMYDMRPSSPLTPQIARIRFDHHRNTSLDLFRSTTEPDLLADHAIDLGRSAASHGRTGPIIIDMRGSKLPLDYDRGSPIPPSSRKEWPSRGLASGKNGRNSSVRGSRRSVSVSGAIEDICGRRFMGSGASRDLGEPEVVRKDIGLRGLVGLGARGRRPGKGRRRLMTD